MVTNQTGVWLVGARGSVAATVAVGLSALARGEASPAGLVTETGPFAGVELPGWDQLVLGGHEIRDGRLTEAVRDLEAARVVPHGSAEHYREELEAIDGRIRSGVLFNSGAAVEALAAPQRAVICSTPREAIQQVANDLQAFREANQLQRVVVVLLSSTEPPIDREQLPESASELEALLDDSHSALRASALYALGAAEAGAALVNFTPSLGADFSAAEEIFFQHQVPHCGRDGKTGETLLKSVLAPMFAARGLQVDSWVGHNLLGNRDGAILNDPANKNTKVESKEQLLDELLGYGPQSHVSIEAIDSLGEWKTAWDHVHFRGFLGVPMTLQFTWQGCDSTLAAPLVMDLVRLIDLAMRRKERGAIGALAAFFKSPVGTAARAFGEEMQTLLDWAHGNTTRGSQSR